MTTATFPSTTTSPTGNAVLVLSTSSSNNKPFIVDFNGKYHTFFLDIEMDLYLGNINEDLAFEYGDGTTAYRGCGATLNNEFWYFGGSNKRQVKSQNYSLDIYLFYFRLVK